MDRSKATDLLAAAIGQAESQELTPELHQFVAGLKEGCQRYLCQTPCECNRCLRQYRTVEQQGWVVWRYLGQRKDPAGDARSFVESIKEDRQFLYQKILASGPALLKRWRGGEGKRRAYLMKAQPDIYPFSQPLIDIASRVKMLSEARKLRAAYLLPYVNVEDLARNSTNFIRLLHYRTVFTPQDFVHFDNAQLQPGWQQGGLGEKSADGCIIMQGKAYGTWRQFDHQAVHNGHAYGSNRGLLILEAQQTLMSFLRKMVTTILNDSDACKPGEVPPETLKESLASAPLFQYDLTSCSKWMRFVEAQPYQDQAWLSVASVYTQQPYSAPTGFDIDLIIEIAESKAQEAEDELWLLQTDLDYFHDVLKRHEREWLDSVPSMDELKNFNPKNKMDNIAYNMTVEVVIQTRDWQWLWEVCLIVKREMEKLEAKIRVGERLPIEYERALCGLHYLLWKAQSWYQLSLSKLFRKSQGFQSTIAATAVGKIQGDSWVLGTKFKDYSQLYQDDRIGWCLYNLAKDSEEVCNFERSVVLQHLEKSLETCPRQEFDRIDREMYKCISDMAAIEKMASILDLHRPNSSLVAEDPFSQPSQAWRVHACMLIKPSDINCASMDLGSALESSARSRVPTGTRDKEWMVQRDQAQQSLNDLWEKARHAYRMILETSDVSQDLIEPQLAVMRLGECREHKIQGYVEKQQILGRLRAGAQKALTELVIPPIDTPSGVSVDGDQPAHHIQDLSKDKTDASAAWASLQSKYAAAFARLTIDNNDGEKERSTPILYTLKQDSAAFQVVSLMFPDRSKSLEDGRKAIDWLDFVSTMNTLGFAAEHRGGSLFVFKGGVRLPSDPLTLQERSIGVHMPHPGTEMSPIMLQSLGRRCNRRFGWQRASFMAEDSDVGRGTPDANAG